MTISGPRQHGTSEALRVGAAAIILSLMVTACVDSTGPMAPLPQSPPTVEVTMREYRFDYDAHIASGRVVFRLINAGRRLHRPALIPLAEDLPPLVEQLRGPVRRPAEPFAGVYGRVPGATGTFAVDLVAGRRYGFICYATDGGGISHGQKGMASEFRAGIDHPGPSGDLSR